MTPQRFLRIGGAFLIAIGMLGVTGRLSSISRASFFRPPYWINWFHLSFGTTLSALAFSNASRLQERVSLFGAFVGTTIGLAGLLFGRFAARRYDVPELADPSDHVAHLTVGLLALWGWRNRANRPDAAFAEGRATKATLA